MGRTPRHDPNTTASPASKSAGRHFGLGGSAYEHLLGSCRPALAQREAPALSSDEQKGQPIVSPKTASKHNTIIEDASDSSSAATSEPVNPGETGRRENYCVGVTSVGLLIQAGPGSGGGTGGWRTKRSGCIA